MRLKKHTLSLNVQKWFIFVSYLILLACSPGSKKIMGSVPGIPTTGKDYNTVNKLAYEEKSNENEKTLLTVQLDNIERKKTKPTQVVLLIIMALTGFIIILIQQHQLKKQKMESSLYIDGMSSESFTDSDENIQKEELLHTLKYYNPNFDYNNPSVLIVENNKDMFYYLSSFLEENYNIFTADNGKKAIRKAAGTMPDIIISNITIPGMNGYDLCKEIKNSDTTAHIPVILLSAYGSREERVKGFRCGADAFLSKPVFEDELLAVIDQLVTVRKLELSAF
ncbi:Response regulator receiver domain-containing protein [Porphyromonadaceae bacterium KH3CP3RA]|nr:Response regulator receiver domain-containing protein [Porphyromonadaceae bacterium KH3CP3RA]